jgi:hypothetical protein
MHAPAAEPAVASDLSCVRCGYNLRTLSESAVCPECGRAVSESLAAARVRVPERVRWLLARATEMFLLAAVASAATSFWPTDNPFRGASRGGPVVQLATWSAALLPPVAAWWGAVLVARSLGPEGTRRIARRLVQFGLILTATVPTFGPALIYSMPSGWRGVYNRHGEQVLLAIAVCAAVATLLTFLWLSAVARAARRRWLAWQCVALVVVVPAAVVWMRLSEIDLWLGFGRTVRLKEFALPVVGYPPAVRWLWGLLRNPLWLLSREPSVALAVVSFLWATFVIARFRHVIRTA